MSEQRAAPDNHFLHPTLAAVYDITCGWSQDRDFYLNLADPGSGRLNVLDLGCGTGLLCDAYAAQGHRVTGVDPAVGMLQVAAAKPNGRDITWVQAYAQDYAPDKFFDLVIMTGHAFQVMLSDADVLSLFARVRGYLGAGGRFVFESRNPAIDWRERWHNRLTRWQSPRGEFTQSTHILGNDYADNAAPGNDGEMISFEHVFTFVDEALTSTSTIRFMPRSHIEHLLNTAGLHCRAVYGDWDGSAFEPHRSPEMIFTAC